MVRDAVIVMHGTTGSGGSLIRPECAGELGPGQPRDASRYSVILPDGIGHGRSSRPGEALSARLPHYGYRDMIAPIRGRCSGQGDGPFSRHRACR